MLLMGPNASCCYCTALLPLPVVAATAAAAGQSCVLLLVDLLGSYKAYFI
jgi:hypothetical protein